MVCFSFSWKREMIRIILCFLSPILKMICPEWHGNRNGFISGYIFHSTSLDPEKNACLLGHHMAASTAAKSKKCSQGSLTWKGVCTWLKKMWTGLQPHIMRSKKVLEETVLLHHCSVPLNLHSYLKYLHHWCYFTSTTSWSPRLMVPSSSNLLNQWR